MQGIMEQLVEEVKSIEINKWRNMVKDPPNPDEGWILMMFVGKNDNVFVDFFTYIQIKGEWQSSTFEAILDIDGNILGNIVDLDDIDYQDAWWMSIKNAPI